DHLGMPKELVDQAGLLAWAAAHSVWGKVVETQANPLSELNRGRKVSSPFRLLGQYADEETGLCYARFRYFDPEVGRWGSPDPLVIIGGANLCGFNGSPLSRIDPLGLSDSSPHGDDSKPKELPKLKVDDEQFGKKVGKHASDFGLDPSKPEDRKAVREKIDDI